MELPFVSAGRTHADDANGFRAQGDEHHRDDTLNRFANGAPALAIRRQKQRVVEEGLIEISEVQPVLGQFASRFGSSHTIRMELLCSYNLIAVNTSLTRMAAAAFLPEFCPLLGHSRLIRIAAPEPS
jgi:hypothetical protein